MTTYLYGMGSIVWFIAVLFMAESASSGNNGWTNSAIGAFFVGVAFFAMGSLNRWETR